MSSSSDDLVEVATEQSEDRSRADAADDVESAGNRKDSSDASDTSDTSGEVITTEQEDVSLQAQKQQLVCRQH